jgi:hypothetical protein
VVAEQAEPLLSIADVMAWTRVSRGTVYNLVRRGELVPTYVGDLPRLRTRIAVLADRAAGKVLVSVRVASEADLEKGAAAFEAMSPPDTGKLRRVSVDAYEVLIDQLAT